VVTLRLLFLRCGLVVCCWLSWHDAVAGTIDGVDFSSQIRPILSAKCFPCHGPDEAARKAKLRLDLRDDAVVVHKHGKPIDESNIDSSQILQRIATTDPDEVMPPPEAKNPVKPEEAVLLRRWIEKGAVYSPHWAWTPPRRPNRPKVSSWDWPRNGIDTFVLASLESRGLHPSPEADRATLVRRLSLDLTGLPPAPETVERFLQDASPRAYEHLVDSLLSSPHFGEQWARLWLDLGRYADSAGYGSDPLRPNIWPWRDWLISALNRNLPFDQFTREVLAGDLLPDAEQEQLVATAFHRNTMTNTEGGTDDEEWRVAAVKDRANVTFQVWMGLTVGCAQCHSHKFDPISQKEYYSVYALFNQTEDNDQPDESPTRPLRTPAQARRVRELDQQIGAAEALLSHPTPELKDQWDTYLGPPSLLFNLEQWRRERRSLSYVSLPIMKELPPDRRRVTHILNKGNYLDPGQEVQPGLLSAFHPFPGTLPTNRLGLAAWLTAPENPLTARVAVNRFWSRLMGRALVETEEDFGTQGSLPSNQDLLDWLAVSFQSSGPGTPEEPALGWSFKALVKLIVESSTYRQSSSADPALLEKDPLNRWYGRATRRRLDAETIRDQALDLSGLLSRKMGGPSVYPYQPEGLWRAAFNGERTWQTSLGEDRYRRGLYTFWRRTVPYPSMATFDVPSRESCTVRRLPSNTPLQALVTLNDPVFVEAAQSLGRRLANRPGSVSDRIRWGLHHVQIRSPNDSDIRVLAELWEKEVSDYRTRPDEARRVASDPLGPIPADLDAAEAAAWTEVGNVLLNLDSILTRS
jgi:Protein of unknown function (DUF1553)/Protein of unknown function (DUF1549)/Planctomycete cytochrome C